MSQTDSCVLYRVPARGLSRRGLREFARRLQAEVTGGRTFCCLVTSDEELRRLNKQFRKKDYATDVLSFPLPHDRGSERGGRGSDRGSERGGRGSERGGRGSGQGDGGSDRGSGRGGRGSERAGRGSAGNGGPLGELAISWDRAKAQAAEYGHSADDEMRILMLHGVLHLNGMDHEKDRGEMARSEARWRKRLNLPSGLIERVPS